MARSTRKNPAETKARERKTAGKVDELAREFARLRREGASIGAYLKAMRDVEPGLWIGFHEEFTRCRPPRRRKR